MPPPPPAPSSPPAYWAFISYSHADDAWGRWLHRALESYRIPRALVGQPGLHGPVPRRLFPVFRDRDELSSSAELGSAIEAALRAARCQVVICSPHAAASRWVNEEIRSFKRLGRQDRILALIVDGEPHASEQPGSGRPECFPVALRQHWGSDGEPDGQPAEPIAADLRPGRDSRRDAVLKLVAGILGLNLDALRQREKVRARWRAAGVAALGLGVIALAVGIWEWQDQRRLAELQQARIARYTEIGRQELLAEQRSRAAVYLSAAYSLGGDSPALRLMLAQALQVADAQARRFAASRADAVLDAGYSPDGRQVVALQGEYDDSGRFPVRLWDAHSGRPLWPGVDARSSLRPLFSADRRHLFMAYPTPPVERSGASEPRTAAASGFEPPQGSTWTWEIRETATGKVWRRLTGLPPAHTAYEASQFSPLMSPQGARLVSEGENGRALVWEYGGTAAPRPFGGPGTVSEAAWSRDGGQLWLGYDDGHLERIDAASGQRLARIARAAAAVSALVLSEDGQQLALGDDRGRVELRDAHTGRLLQNFGGHANRITSLSFGQRQRLVSCGIGGGDIKVWDLGTGTLLLVRPNPGLGGSFYSPRLSPDGQLLLVGAGDLPELWSIAGQRRLMILDGHRGALFNAEFSPDGRHILTSGKDGYAIAWRTDTRPGLRLGTAASGQFKALALSGDGRRIAVRDAGGWINAWSLPDGARLAQFEARTGPGNAFDLSPDGHWLAYADGAGRLSLRALGAGTAAREWDLGQAVSGLQFAPDNSDLLTVTDREARLWSAATGQPRQRFPGPAEGIEGAGFSANGRQVLIRGKDLQAQLWDRESGQPLQSFRGHEWKIADFDLASDGRLATASWDASLRVWEPASGRELARLYLPDDGAFFRVRFSADGQRLLAGEEHNSAKIWDLRDGRVTSLRGIAGGVFHVRWLADDRLALTASADGDVRVWDADDGRPLAVVAAVGGPVPIVRIDPAQRWLATTSRQDEQVGIWSLALEQRTPETVAALLRCRSPWMLGDEALEARRPPREDCHIDTHPKVTGAAP